MHISKDSIKRYLPNFLKNMLRAFRSRVLIPHRMRKQISKIRQQHERLIEEKKKKKVIKVVFLVIHRSVWKVDNIFQQLLSHPDFEPVIVVCPYTVVPHDQMLNELNESVSYFSNKGYPVVSSYNPKNGSWLELSSIEPDVLFFTNPHRLTLPEYYENAYRNYLSVYLTYHYEVGRYDNDQSQYNQEFHNLMWKIFAPHEVSLDTFRTTATAKGDNVVVTGFPPCEELVEMKELGCDQVWKQQQFEKTKIIWAPHHTIDDPKLPYATFLKYAEFFKELAISTKDRVQWAFKPHPVLYGKLCKHAEWGEKRAREYFDFWKTGENTQLEESGYVDLFLQSDALIHDSGSFLAEYLLVQKPALFLKNNERYRDYYNSFGIRALEAHYIAESKSDIEEFVTRIVNHELESHSSTKGFLRDFVNPYFKGTDTPSSTVVSLLEQHLVRVKEIE